jgi:chromosome segregation ATPase
MKLTNPLYYPIAVLTGGLTLFVGVRLIQLPSIIMLPAAAGIAVVGAAYLKSREPESFELDNPELEQELQTLKTSALALATQANKFRLESKKLLTDSFQLELLAAIQTSCDHATEIPTKVDNLARRLQATNSLLSTNELQQQLAQVQQRANSSTGIAKQHLDQLADSLKRNIQLAQEGQDTRLAQILNISTQIQDSAGVLQQLQTKLPTTDLTDGVAIGELQSLADELVSLQENVYLLLSK